MKRTVYIAGPMRGYPEYNFSAFLAAEATLRGTGFSVISPASMDIAEGFDPRGTPQSRTLSHAFILRVVERDLAAIRGLRPKYDAVVVLPGWKKSKGATAEVAVARWLGIPVLKYPRLEVIE